MEKSSQDKHSLAYEDNNDEKMMMIAFFSETLHQYRLN